MRHAFFGFFVFLSLLCSPQVDALTENIQYRTHRTFDFLAVGDQTFEQALPILYRIQRVLVESSLRADGSIDPVQLQTDVSHLKQIIKEAAHDLEVIRVDEVLLGLTFVVEGMSRTEQKHAYRELYLDWIVSPKEISSIWRYILLNSWVAAGGWFQPVPMAVD